ncbi:hypothetical protein [Streptomyces sp. BRA346]|uniref:hypothetical protein n=1 Tax=Streptomyces sp. BRA346 TaxID=2878199 RepID=UPI004063AE79
MSETRVVDSASPEEDPEPATTHELEQATSAYSKAKARIKAHRLRKGVPHVDGQVDDRRRAFVLGFVTGVRTGHTGPALADRALPAADLSAAMRDSRSEDLIDREVQYHGSLTRHHGYYYISGVIRRSEGGPVKTFYELRRFAQRTPALREVREESVTLVEWGEV